MPETKKYVRNAMLLAFINIVFLSATIIASVDIHPWYAIPVTLFFLACLAYTFYRTLVIAIDFLNPKQEEENK